MLDILTTTVEGKTYKEFQSEMCPDPTPEPSPPPPPSGETISSGTAAAISVVPTPEPSPPPPPSGETISPGTAAAISVVPTPEPSPQLPYTAIIAGAVRDGGCLAAVIFVVTRVSEGRPTKHSTVGRPRHAFLSPALSCYVSPSPKREC
jgi:hypothetical protein